MFTTVNKKNLSDEIGDQIINKILSGILPPGEKLPPERDMSLQMNVNRHTLREALRKLETLGLPMLRRAPILGANGRDRRTPARRPPRH